MNDGRVSTAVTLICNINANLFADCPPGVTITPSDGPPYEAGDVLTCAADGGSPTYAWSGTNGGSEVSSTSTTVILEAGEFCLICTATISPDADCSARAYLCDNAYSKYRKKNIKNVVTSLLLETCPVG